MAWGKTPENGRPQGTETPKPAYPLHFDFRDMNSAEGVSAQKLVSMKGNILTLGSKSFPLDTNTKDVSVSRYTGDGQKWLFLQILVTDKDGTSQKIWLDQYGQLLKREPKGGVPSAEDIKDIMLGR